jgi:hypothetical protein
MNTKPLALALLWCAGLAPLAGRADPPAPVATDAQPAPAKAPAPAAATPVATDAKPPPAGKDAAGPAPGPAPGKATDAARSTPQHFEPTEKTRADFEVSFPIDI